MLSWIAQAKLALATKRVDSAIRMMLMAQDSVSVVPDSQITKSSDDTCTVKWGKACYHGAIVASGNLGDFLPYSGNEIFHLFNIRYNSIHACLSFERCTIRIA